MAYKPYNNNDKTLTVSTFSAVGFSNPASEIAQSKLNISYFNKVMKISIALRNNAGSNDGYATYNNDNAPTVYISNTKAKILVDLIDMLRNDPDVHNVCVESRTGMLKVSDGSEFGSTNPCISITYASEDGSTHEVVYETKAGFHTGAYNYQNGTFESKSFDDIELDTFRMTLEQYYYASSYAIAATVKESEMYRREAEMSLIKAIAEKVGVPTGGNSGKYNNKSSFLGSNGGGSSAAGAMNPPTGSNSMIPKEYETSSFDDIANSMG